MATIDCPGCQKGIAVDDADHAVGHILRCKECGMKIVLQRKYPGSDVIFPVAASPETLLDMGDTDFKTK